MSTCRAMQYLQIADACEPGSAITTFMRLKVNLEQGDSVAAAEQICKLSSDEETTHRCTSGEVVRIKHAAFIGSALKTSQACMAKWHCASPV